MRWIKVTAIVVIAVLAEIAGNLSRPYRAFGGEDMLCIALTIWAIYEVRICIRGENDGISIERE